MKMRYNIMLVHSEEGWAVWVTDRPGIASQGRTREEAVENIKIAIREVEEVERERLLREEGVLSCEREMVTV